ncbi:MAG: tetratricopeptide repeat protein [Deltaproteobacteria bacterium]|nr:tetratricopeptide repeat protein [Deltaproteobacteria bacterium]
MKIIKKIYRSIKAGWSSGQANVKEQKGKLEESIDLHLKAATYCDDVRSKILIIENISDIYLKLGRFKDALDAAKFLQNQCEKNINEDNFFKETSSRLLVKIEQIKTANNLVNRTE